MPGFDRTGPMGQGPGTGRGLGWCRIRTRADAGDQVLQQKGSAAGCFPGRDQGRLGARPGGRGFIGRCWSPRSCRAGRGPKWWIMTQRSVQKD